VPLPQDEGYKAGEVARSGAVLKAEKLAVEAWRQQGHAKAKIADRRVEAAHDQDVLDANITVQPGPVTYYGPVSVTGSERMDAEFIAYMTGLHQGEEFDPDDLERANKRLSRLEVFRALRIEEGELGQGGLMPIAVTVQERALRRFGVGASYSTLDGAGFEAFWLHRNLFGRAERLRFDAKIAGLGPTVDPEELTYRVGATSPSRAFSRRIRISSPRCSATANISKMSTRAPLSRRRRASTTCSTKSCRAGCSPMAVLPNSRTTFSESAISRRSACSAG
jgi:translocation and assembly module TamA